MTYTYMYFNNYKQISIILQFTICRKKLFFKKKSNYTKMNNNDRVQS